MALITECCETASLGAEILKNWDNRIEPAGHLAKWWDWDSIGPRYDEYRRLVRARNGNH
jgi:hypothetical protein